MTCGFFLFGGWVLFFDSCCVFWGILVVWWRFVLAFVCVLLGFCFFWFCFCANFKVWADMSRVFALRPIGFAF